MAPCWWLANWLRKNPTATGMRQYNNHANWQAHYGSTGPEIVAQTNEGVTHFIAGLGTSGTLMGTGRYLREQLPEVKIIAFQPDASFHGLEGLKHMPTAINQAFTTRPSRMKTRQSKPKMLMKWSCVWRAKKACLSASHPARRRSRRYVWRKNWMKVGRSLSSRMLAINI